MCDFTIKQSRTPTQGNDVTYSVDPPVSAPCRVDVRVNRATVTSLGDNGQLRVIGIGAAGPVTVRPLTDPPAGSVMFIVTCPEPPSRVYTREYVIGIGVVAIPEPSGDPPIELPKTAWKPKISQEAEDHNRAVAAREDAERERYGEPKGREEKGRIVVPIPLIPNPFGDDDQKRRHPTDDEETR